MTRLQILLFALVVLLTGCAARPTPTPVPTPVNKDFLVTVTFNYDFTNFVPCSPTVTKGCITGFSWGYMQGAIPVPLKTSLPAVCTGINPKTCTDSTNSTVGIGNVVPFVVANGLDNNGAVVASNNILGTAVNVKIGDPTNPVETFQ
jgi:hypothetical protein